MPGFPVIEARGCIYSEVRWHHVDDQSPSLTLG
ncbi:hypothetical protein HNQ80_004556 [Anaerosolibacter carboniphilus]|uniref:Uncharacterized protein n=1 Tax=Anaerosolibacter carboniphilus TaxID=1417629 RepID=A0A841L5K7_9FIRM|nr:hypothetical protein [Anaerosolibacter carboniphilus]